MKKIFTLMAVFAMTMAAMAQNKASLEIVGFDKTSLSVRLNNNFPVATMGFKFDLPEGTTVVGAADDEEEIDKNSTRVPKKASIDVQKTATGYSINIYGGGGIKDVEGVTEVCTIALEGAMTGDVKFYGINFADFGDGTDVTTIKSYYMEDDPNYVYTVTLNPDAINGISADETKSGVIYNMAGQRVSKATKGIYVVDGKKVAVK